MKAILGKKVGMTTLYDEARKAVPVTVILAGPCKVSQVKTQQRDGYQAVQLAFDEVSEKRATKPEKGHLAAAGWSGARFIREFRTDGSLPEVGSDVPVTEFAAGDIVKVSATSKGKGFLGVVGRHHFAGGGMTHGSMTHRRPGSIGASSYPARVMPGRRMGGHTGSARVTVKGLTVFAVDAENNLILIRGAVPGSNGTYVEILG